MPVDAQNDQVRLFCSQGTRAKYVALSHCWGGKIELVLETGNLNTFQNSIPCSSLAATFRDAITITRNLGIRYLWIDSLCIIQNSRDDWEQELNNMGPIFRDSTLALFAAASKNSNEGILNKEPSLLYPKEAQLKVFSDPEDYTTVMASMRCYSPGESFEQMWSQSPLATRGWTFQEQALAPRCLVYGEKGICWKCPRGLSTSKLSYVRDVLRRAKTIDPILHSPTPPCDPSISMGLLRLMDEYYELVSAYSRRALTLPSDKLPAMSAIAKALSHKLAQETHRPPISLSYAPHVSTYRAPSWSWATTDSPITFAGICDTDWDRRWRTDLRVVSCEVFPLTPGCPFGEVKSGRLVVEGRMIPLVRSRQVVQTAGFESISMGRCKYDECLDGENPYHSESRIFPIMKGEQRLLLTFVEKSRAFGGSNLRKCGELEIDQESCREEEYKAVIISIADIDPQEPQEEMVARGILVQRRPGSEEYERIGSLYNLYISCTWLDSIQREKLAII
ncbi:hypothetical protein MRS44_014319 [Fusarium solani]|uniref:uncharacterized protein n=1 Tax=Fusarium solani TaxID=169388 RepID=UPI0032C48351|nr:hypothetical protein MRS44_014319 [Fusarium solani]